MKKVLLSALVIVAFIIYAVHKNTDTEGKVAVIAPKQSNSGSSNTSGTGSSSGVSGSNSSQNNSPTPNSGANPNSNSGMPMMGNYKNGSYTGSTEDAFYGNVQVKATINNGKITDVTFLQYPNDRSTSVYINSQAMPYLRQEAISVQSANVDVVSGATDTSMAFQQSLANALSQAK